jgi:ATP-binding cassette subfamily F protein 3
MISINNVSVEFGANPLFDNISYIINKRDRIALVGRNGEGKTTLMRVIMKELDPMDGEAKIGHNVNIGYYAQNQEDILDKQDTVFGTLDRIAVGDIRLKLRDILAAFLFKGEDIDKKVAVLSGGERARLAMAKLMLNPYNLLALDEPTNHMDIRSKDILKQALQKYDGTLVVVSHDRDFLDGLVDKLYEFRDGKVKEHLGGVQDFLDRRKMETLNELERNNKIVEEKPQEVIQKKEESKQEYKAQKFISKEEKKIRNRISFLEKGIAQIEEKMKEIETVLMNPGPDDDIMDLTREYLENKRELDAKTDEWANLMETIEE